MNYGAFTNPINSTEFNEYKRSDAVKKQWLSANIEFYVFTSILMFAYILFLVAILHEGPGAIGKLPVGLLLAATPLIIAFVIFRVYKNKQMIRHFRLQMFGKDNKLAVHIAVKGNSNYPGMIFQVGRSVMLSERISAKDNTYVVGNYTYVTGSGKSQQTHRNGFMMLQLPRRLPHMVLDGKKNNTRIFGMELSNLPTVFKKEQTLALEGNFNDYFTLYAPKEYERDALYVFTPDLMALLIDNVAQYDAEVVDDKLFIYGVGTFNLLDQTVWERLMRIKDAVGAKVITQTDYYADERVGDRAKNIIAPGGMRLKQGVGVVGIVFIALYVIFTIIDIFNG